MFNEKKEEYSAKQGKKIPVWQSPKYEESKDKAKELIDSGKYGLKESDFWILMNETKSGSMGYTGLIISHNGCLKINDALECKFNPGAVTIDKEGFNGSLVYTYADVKQGIYEVGEVSARNCKNDYPYAMAFKRLFDRVVLKLSKIAYAGIYGEDEADSFRDPLDDTKPEKKESKKAKKIPDKALASPNLKRNDAEWINTPPEEKKSNTRQFGDVAEKEVDSEVTTDEKKKFLMLCKELEVDFIDIFQRVGVTGKITREQYNECLLILKGVSDERNRNK